MGETVFDFRCQRARAVRVFGFAVKIDGHYKIRRGRGRQNNFTARLDFQFDISAVRRADQRFFDVCRQLYSAMAFLDVAFISKANLHQSVVSRRNYLATKKREIYKNNTDPN